MTEFLGRIYSWLAFIAKDHYLGNLFESSDYLFPYIRDPDLVQNTKGLGAVEGRPDDPGLYLGASLLRLNTITWMINHMGQLALIALLIIFQPELRKALEQLGS